MFGKDKIFAVEIWMGLMILCLAAGEVHAKASCYFKCLFSCVSFLHPYHGCFETCMGKCEGDAGPGGSVVSTAAAKCAFTCVKEKCAKFAPDSKKAKVCAQSCANDCHLT
ncbi:uncharacterized protein LOC131331575 [Rhododendron vialii]|uniref:uncharacterized protein LOC131331575 n=1 Tax=Rhododendron vialii TaxID=182163 RepID=UPI00265FDEAF|nr:uncharacterized protein LOC131331575 [Rhododendron vialii]